METLCVTVFLLWCHGEGNGVTFDVTNYYHISPRSCAWLRCICLAFQISHGWKRRDLETCFSLSLCCGCSATARGTAGVLQCREYGPEAERVFPCTGPGDPQGIGVPRVSSSFDFWLFLTRAGWGLSQCVFCLQCRVRKALPVWSISRPRTCSPRKSL